MLQAKLKELREKFTISSEAKEIFWEIGLFILGFFLMGTRFLFGTLPFGIAFISASKKYTPFVFAGAILSVVFLMSSSVLYIVALVGLLGLRIAASFIKKKGEFQKSQLGEKQGDRIAKSLFCEDKELRVAVGGLCALGIGIYNVISNGYVYYDVFVLVFNTVFVCILTYCFTGAFEERGGQSYLLGLGTVAFALIYAISGIEIFGIDISIILSYSIVLYSSKHLDGIKAGAIGLILGISQGATLSATLGVGGVVSGFLWSISPYLSVMCAFILSMGYGIAMLGYEAIVFLTPELLAASLIMYPLIRFELIPSPSFLKSKGGSMEIYRLETENGLMLKRADKLCVALGQVAGLFKEISDKTKSPDKKGYIDMALECCEASCYACPKESICWKRDSDTTKENINKMGIALFTKKEVVKTDVTEKFLHRCPNIEKIMEELNKRNKELLLRGVKNDKLDVSSQDYEMISRLIIDTVRGEGVVKDKTLSDKAVRVGAKCGLVCHTIEVVGDVEKCVIATGVDIQRSKCTAETLKEEMEKGIEIALGETEIFDNGTDLTIVMRKKAEIDVTVYKSEFSPREENGDTAASFKAEETEYMLICDGMGSGREAHLTSYMCSSFLETILGACNNIQLCLSMLNSFVRAKNMECSSTVDLFSINRITRQGRLIKCGAAPSFVKRDKEIYTLQAKTAPLGIMRGLDAEEISVTLNKGDICVMVSDGVVGSKQDAKWLTELLQEYTKPTEELCCDIIREARAKEGKKDDMSVIVAVIK